MKVLLTGATGFIGSRVRDLLLKEGMHVTALVRSDDAVAKALAGGCTPVRGSLTSLDLIAGEASAADAVIHCAFNVDHTLSQWDQAHALDVQVCETILLALKGSGKAFICTSAGEVLGTTAGPADEFAPIPPRPGLTTRAKTEEAVLLGAQHGVRTVILRLPLHVYDSKGSGFTQAQQSKALELGHALFFNDGGNVASNVHVNDAAALFLLALKHARAGSLYHGASGSASGRQIAEAVALKHGLQALSLPSDQACEVFGIPLGILLTLSNENSSTRAKHELGWKPQRHDFLECVSGQGH